MGYCSICDMNFSDIDLHLETYHKPKPEKENKGDFYCPLCRVKVGNKQRHYCSALHRNNVRRNEVNLTYGLKEYKIYFDKYCNDQTVKALGNKKLEDEDPFWSAGKEDLNEEDYKRLKEYANGRGKNIGSYSRNSGLRRFSRTSKSKQADRQKISRRKSYSRI